MSDHREYRSRNGHGQKSWRSIFRRILRLCRQCRYNAQARNPVVAIRSPTPILQPVRGRGDDPRLTIVPAELPRRTAVHDQALRLDGELVCQAPIRSLLRSGPSNAASCRERLANRIAGNHLERTEEGVRYPSCPTHEGRRVFGPSGENQATATTSPQAKKIAVPSLARPRVEGGTVARAAHCKGRREVLSWRATRLEVNAHRATR